MSEPFTVVDEGEIEALAAFRKLSPPQRKAAIRMAERLATGEPIQTAGLAFLVTAGMDPEEAERLISNLPTEAQGDAS